MKILKIDDEFEKSVHFITFHHDNLVFKAHIVKEFMFLTIGLHIVVNMRMMHKLNTLIRKRII